MSENAEYLRTGDKYTVPSDATITDEMTVRGVRDRIRKMVGAKSRGKSPLTFQTLNSVCAYLTGKFYLQPADINTVDSPGIGHARRAVAVAVGKFMFPPANRTRPFRKRELVDIAKTLEEADDARSWTPGGGEGGGSRGE